MSHFSQIRTNINNIRILQKTLTDLGFEYEDKKQNIKDDGNSLIINIIVKKNKKDIFKLEWTGKEYTFVADLQFWKETTPFDQLIDQITQQYSYNSIIEESIKQGFTNIEHQLMQNGSIKLTIQRWN